MTASPARQRDLRRPRPTRPPARALPSAAHQDALARRLTDRDRWLLAMLHEHRVLTTPQITALAFPSPRSARQRLYELYQWSVLHRFRPHHSPGSAPQHYVLAPTGAALLATAHHLGLNDLGYRHDRALNIAHSLRLAHTIAVNGWFISLITHTHHHPRHALTAWWSETRCARLFGDLVRPDAYGRWATGADQIEFFLEYDTGSEPLRKVTAKLLDYAALATATTITTPVLLWFPTSARETSARRALTRLWRTLDHPRTVPVATAAADRLTAAHPSPADLVWLPLDLLPSQTVRQALHQLRHTWPHLTSLTRTTPTTAPRARASLGGRLPVPNPHCPACHLPGTPPPSPPALR